MKQIGVTKTKGTKTLKDRVHQHLKDKNDVITEDDLKNIKVGEDESETKLELKEENENAKELAKAIEDNKQSSPWNILSGDDK